MKLVFDSTIRCGCWLLTAFALCTSYSGMTPVHAAENPVGRYQMERTDKGILRLDTQTGQVSLCSDSDGRWSCSSITQDQDALAAPSSGRLAELERENARLKDDVKRLEDMIGMGGKDKEPAARGFTLPSEEDIDKAMTTFEKMLRRFKDAMKDLESDLPKKETPL